MPKQLNKRLKRRASLYILGLLNSKQVSAFEKQMNRFEDLKQYVVELKTTLEMTQQLPHREPTEAFLKGQRNLLRGRIEMLAQESLSTKIVRRMQYLFDTTFKPFPFTRPATIAVITSLIVGLLAGRFLFTTSIDKSLFYKEPDALRARILNILEQGQLTTSQIKYLKNGSDKVMFHLKAEDEYTYSGHLNDALVKELLTYFLLHETNPGNRLKSIKLMAETGMDENLISAYVSALLTDNNPGVRLRAIKQLSQYPFNPMIRNICMKVLLEDENTAIRMEAIKILASNPDERLVPILQIVSHLDDNEYIREQASDILSHLEEVSNSEVAGE